MTLTIEGLSEAIVTEAITAVVAEKGADYVYPGWQDNCKYVVEDENGNLVPDCIVGHVLHRLGAPLSEVRNYEGTTPQSSMSTEFGLPDKVAAALTAAQRLQDEGSTWGDALQAYNKEMEN